MELLTRIGCSGENVLIGVEYDFEDTSIQILRTHFQKGKLLISESKSFQQMQDFQKYLLQWPAVPIILAMKNAQVVEKWVPLKAEDKIKAVLGVQVENRQDFIYEEIQGSKDLQLLSLIRKEAYHQARHILGSHTDRLIGCYLNEASKCFLIPALTNYTESTAYSLEGKKTYSWQGELIPNTEDCINLTDHDLSSELLIEVEYLGLYASVLLFYLQEKQEIWGIPELSTNRQTHSKKSKISKGLIISLALFLCLALSTTLIQAWFATQHSQALATLTTQQSTLDQINRYKASVQEKTAFLSGNQEKTLSPSQVAWHIDQLSALAPKDLAFERILFHPKTQQLKKIDLNLESREFDLLIQGESTQAQALTAFSSTLAEQVWLKEAEIFNSQYDYREQRHQFTLLLRFNDGEIF